MAPDAGAGIVRVGATTIEGEDGGDLLWAVRLEVDGAGGVTVPLGETRGGAVEYAATDLVALFGRRAARAFPVCPGGPSAWGTDLPS
jgi:hypothetical protein